MEVLKDALISLKLPGDSQDSNRNKFGGRNYGFGVFQRIFLNTFVALLEGEAIEG